MTGLILDGVLMVLLVVALGYGVRLERKLTALRAGQQAFASAVTELNAAAGRAESALASLRASGPETDLLHDRIIKAREVRGQLESLITRGAEFSRPVAVETPKAPAPSKAGPVAVSRQPTPVTENDNEARAQRMAALAEHIQALAAPGRTRADVAAILGAMTANQSVKQSLNRVRRNLDEDLFAA
jgi:hypothetical protein